MPSTMAGVALSVLLATATLQQAHAGPWVPDWLSVSPLDNIQRLVQQRQQRKLRSTPTLSAVAAAVPSEQLAVAPLRRQLLQADEAGSYGGYGYGYGEYGYGYGGYAYGDREPAIELSNGSQDLQEAMMQSGIAPTLVYNDSEQPAATAAAAAPSGSSSNSRRLSQVVEAGLAHIDGIELSDVAAVAVGPAVSSELPSERRAARKLLLSASKISVDALDAAVAPLAPVMLEPVDAVLLGSGRALLSMGEGSYGGGYGGYGEYGYGDYGYGGYGAAEADETPASGRALLEAAADDDVSLYQVWLANHKAQHAR